MIDVHGAIHRQPAGAVRAHPQSPGQERIEAALLDTEALAEIEDQVDVQRQGNAARAGARCPADDHHVVGEARALRLVQQEVGLRRADLAAGQQGAVAHLQRPGAVQLQAPRRAAEQAEVVGAPGDRRFRFVVAQREPAGGRELAAAARDRELRDAELALGQLGVEPAVGQEQAVLRGGDTHALNVHGSGDLRLADGACDVDRRTRVAADAGVRADEAVESPQRRNRELDAGCERRVAPQGRRPRARHGQGGGSDVGLAEFLVDHAPVQREPVLDDLARGCPARSRRSA